MLPDRIATTRTAMLPKTVRYKFLDAILGLLRQPKVRNCMNSVLLAFWIYCFRIQPRLSGKVTFFMFAEDVYV